MSPWLIGLSKSYPAPKPKARKRMKRHALQRKSRIHQRRNTPRRIKGKRNPALVAWIHSLPCHRCWVLRCEQTTRTECSHMPFSRRFGDENAVWPLCASCHREAPHSWHNDKREWFSLWGGRSRIAEIATMYTERFYRETGGVA